MQPILPPPIARYVEATNARDVEAMLAVFSANATVRDEGQDMVGRDAIRKWIGDTTRKYGVTLEPMGVSHAGEETTVTAKVSGHFPGSPIELHYRFRIDGETISGLQIC